MLSDRRPGWTRACVFAGCVLLLAATSMTFGQAAQAPDPTAAAQAATAATAAAAAPTKPWVTGEVDTGSTAWMLTSSALVLFMVPGLALFYGGMVRAKNVLNMFLCCMVAIGVIGLQWVIYGYAVAFPVVTPDTSIIGSGDPIVSWLAFDKSLLFLKAFTATDFGRLLTSGDTTGAVSTGVPELAFVMFQGKFAIITPALIVGSLAERIRFGPFVIFMLLWATFVYDPVAHWVWGTGGWIKVHLGALDFAGGLVVHLISGIAIVEPALKPNQPNHSRPAPIRVNPSE